MGFSEDVFHGGYFSSNGSKYCPKSVWGDCNLTNRFSTLLVSNFEQGSSYRHEQHQSRRQVENVKSLILQNHAFFSYSRHRRSYDTYETMLFSFESHLYVIINILNSETPAIPEHDVNTSFSTLHELEYPDYTELQIRVLSFSAFPLTEKTEDLAKAGFFYEGILFK